MDSFSFYNPTRVMFGTGMIRNLGKELKDAGLKKVLLVAGGGSIRANSVYSQVTDSLKAAEILWAEAWGVRANPTLDKARELIKLARDEQVDAILAVGGGSVIDTSKAIAAGFYMEDVWNAFTGREAIKQALPVYTVLTLSATGSEMNSLPCSPTLRNAKNGGWARR
jgi:alcohol dehydrogenase YqhD (iron-dependent ADH family)